MVTYAEALTQTMTALGRRDNILFVGQSVAYPGNALFPTLAGVPAEKRIELPVAEEMQLGLSIGLAMTGKTVISIFPRMDFLICAMNQLVNHLDKLPIMTQGTVRPKVIIRTAIGSERPLFPGVQHSGDFTDGVRSMLKNIEVVRLDEPDQIFPVYGKALARADGKSTLIIEYGDYYNEK